MSRGRHRHSSVLGRLLPPVGSGVLVVAAVAALVASPDQVVARSVGVAAVVAVVGLALVLRQRDRAARTSAQLAVVRRMRAEERYEEQIAEAEYAAEVAEERATRFGRRLTAEKSRLAKAETEIARLQRERAVMVAEQAMKEAEAARRALEATAFSFFGRPGAARTALRAGAPAPAVGDLADVVGDEALADSERYAVLDGAPVDAAQPPAHQAVEQPPSHRHAESDTEPEVVDLTAHDETELLELPELRAGRS